jgi:hypothetical protein
VVSAAERHVACGRASRGRFRRRLCRRCAPVTLSQGTVDPGYQRATSAAVLVSACVRVRQHMACVRQHMACVRQHVCGTVRLNDAPLWRRMLQHIAPACPCASDVLRVDSCADRRARGCVEHCGDVLRLGDDIDSFMARDAAGATPEGRHGCSWHADERILQCGVWSFRHSCTKLHEALMSWKSSGGSAETQALCCWSSSCRVRRIRCRSQR